MHLALPYFSGIHRFIPALFLMQGGKGQEISQLLFFQGEWKSKNINSSIDPIRPICGHFRCRWMIKRKDFNYKINSSKQAARISKPIEYHWLTIAWFLVAQGLFSASVYLFSFDLAQRKQGKVLSPLIFWQLSIHSFFPFDWVYGNLIETIDIVMRRGGQAGFGYYIYFRNLQYSMLGINFPMWT